jgi:hypothetical protein
LSRAGCWQARPRAHNACGFEILCGNVVANFAVESNSVGADFSGVSKADIVVVEVQRLDEADGVAGDFAVRSFVSFVVNSLLTLLPLVQIGFRISFGFRISAFGFSSFAFICS